MNLSSLRVPVGPLALRRAPLRSNDVAPIAPGGPAGATLAACPALPFTGDMPGAGMGSTRAVGRRVGRLA